MDLKAKDEVLPPSFSWELACECKPQAVLEMRSKRVTSWLPVPRHLTVYLKEALENKVKE